MTNQSLTPELIVNDFQRTLHFYTSILGFSIDYERLESKFAMLSIEGSQIMINERNGSWETGAFEYPLGRGINLQIGISTIAPLLTNLKSNNIVLYQEPEEVWYRKGNAEAGHLEFLVQDPDGYLLRFAQGLGERKRV
jgi:catechol 2,3-dioxygenase-like lactoylglutathione lyase family enzyme